MSFDINEKSYFLQSEADTKLKNLEISISIYHQVAVPKSLISYFLSNKFSQSQYSRNFHIFWNLLYQCLWVQFNVLETSLFCSRSSYSVWLLERSGHSLHRRPQQPFNKAEIKLLEVLQPSFPRCNFFEYLGVISGGFINCLFLLFKFHFCQKCQQP